MSANTIFKEHTDDETLGYRLLRARESAELSQAEVARRLGVKTPTYAAWETDSSEPRANQITLLAGILRVSATWLLNGVGDGPMTETISDEMRILRRQLRMIKAQHEQTGSVLDQMDAALSRLQEKESG